VTGALVALDYPAALARVPHRWNTLMMLIESNAQIPERSVVKFEGLKADFRQ
jgi:hypothetical protein